LRQKWVLTGRGKYPIKMLFDKPVRVRLKWGNRARAAPPERDKKRGEGLLAKSESV